MKLSSLVKRTHKIHKESIPDTDDLIERYTCALSFIEILADDKKRLEQENTNLRSLIIFEIDSRIEKLTEANTRLRKQLAAMNKRKDAD